MTQPLKSRLEAMLTVVYPALNCEALAGELLATMQLGPHADSPPAHENHWD